MAKLETIQTAGGTLIRLGAYTFKAEDIQLIYWVEYKHLDSWHVQVALNGFGTGLGDDFAFTPCADQAEAEAIRAELERVWAESLGKED